MLNAMWLSDQGGAVLLVEDELKTADGVRKILEVLEDAQSQKSLASAAYGLGALHRGPSLVAAIQNATA
jgi:UDP-N-acetylglucosamine:LPS N-acetylglucosamine transferase